MEWFNFEWTIRLTLSANFDGQFEDGLSVSDTLCTAAPSPSEKIGEGMYVGEGGGEGTTVPRLSKTDNPSSNCPSKLADKVRRMVHSKLTGGYGRHPRILIQGGYTWYHSILSPPQEGSSPGPLTLRFKRFPATRILPITFCVFSVWYLA